MATLICDLGADELSAKLHKNLAITFVCLGGKLTLSTVQKFSSFRSILLYATNIFAALHDLATALVQVL